MAGRSSLIWMIACSLGPCLAVLAMGSGATAEITAGMLAPLVATVVSWLVIQRTHADAPERVTNVLVAGFAIKAVLFGVYVAVALLVLDLRPLPFIAAFTSYYVALHVWEAVLLKRLLSSGRA